MSQTKKQDSKAKSLVNKLVEILEELGPVTKKGRNPHFGYAYISEGQMMAELRHRLSSRHVFLLTSVTDCQPHFGEPKAGVFVYVRTVHTFIDADSGEKLEVGGAGLGWDTGDKGVYKAITGATKYALMKNFLVTDEQDPEAGGEEPKGEKAAGAAGHRRTRQYEEETGEGNVKVAGDLLALKAFLTEHKIPDSFLLRLLQDKSLIDGHTKTVAQLKPGIITRCITDKSKANLLKAWKTYEKDQDTGGATAPSDAALAGANAPDLQEPVKTPKGKKKLPANEGNGEVTRTSEGDQTVRERREPIQTEQTPHEVLEMDGYDNWRQVPIHFGQQKATPLGKLPTKSLAWWVNVWQPKPFKGTWNDKDLLLDAALVLASRELSGE